MGGRIKHWRVGRDYAEYTFDGTGIAWISTLDFNRGKAEVWIDGVKLKTVDLHDWSSTSKKIVFLKNDLEAGQHTIMIRVTGAKNSWSSGKRIDIDGFIVMKQ